MCTAALYLVAELQYGSGKKTGLPMYVAQTVSRVLVADWHCAAVIVPAGEWTAKWALSHCSGSPVVEPGSFHVPAVHAVGAVGQLEAQAVVLLPCSQEPPPPALEKLAVSVLLASMAMVTGFADPVAAPLQPVNVAPLAGVAVTVTDVPEA
jgi:hypothetical protein